jgi:Flp pilus assembly protein TadD
MSEESQPAELLRQGIAAAKAGRKEEAHETLLQVIKLDERNEQAWLWLSAVVDSIEEKEICLENVLALNPANARAQAGLDWLRQSRAESEAPAPEAAAPQEPVSEQAAPEPPPVEEFGLDQVAPEELAPEEPALKEAVPKELAPEPAIAEPAGPYMAALDEEPCPRCGAGIRASSSACPSCGLPLIVACPKCGEYAGIEDRTCPNCGQSLGDFRQGSAYHLGLANLYLQNHLADRAQDALERAEAEAAGDPDALAQVGALYDEAGLRSRAIAAYELAIDAAPRDPALYARLAAIYRQHGDRAKATALYEKAEELGSQDPMIACELARLELETGAAQKAVARLQPLVRQQPVEPRAVLLMGDALERVGDQEAAAMHYRRVVQLAPGDTAEGREARSKLAQMGVIPDRQGLSSTSRSAPQERPGCVTIYALLLLLSGAMSLLSAFALAFLYAGGRAQVEQALAQQGMVGLINLNQLTSFAGIALIASILSALFNLAVGVGLLQLKNWARLAVVVLSTLSLVSGFAWVAMTTGAFRETASGFTGFPLPVIVGLLSGFIIEAIIVFWFLTHRYVFD